MGIMVLVYKFNFCSLHMYNVQGAARNRLDIMLDKMLVLFSDYASFMLDRDIDTLAWVLLVYIIRFQTNSTQGLWQLSTLVC